MTVLDGVRPAPRPVGDGRELRTCLHQPNFLPWTKLFDKILGCDVYVAYDSVQYVRTEFHSRQQIGSRSGPVWLSLPVLTRGRGRQALCEVEVVPGSGWRDAHLRMLTEHYRRAPYFRDIAGILADVYSRPIDRLVDINLAVIQAFLDYVGSSVRILRATQFEHAGDNTDRLIQLTRAAGCGIHVTSTFGTSREYIDWQAVAAAGIVVESQSFQEPEYRQLHAPFTPGLSVVDLLLAVGPAAAHLLRERRRIDQVLPVPAGAHDPDRSPSLTRAAR